MKTLFLAFVTSIAAQAAMASDQYICNLKGFSDKGWVPEVLFIGHDAANETVIVSDQIVLYFNKKPVNGKVETDNNVRTTFIWTVQGQSFRGQNVRMKYSATYRKASGKMTINAYPGG